MSDTEVNYDNSENRINNKSNAFGTVAFILAILALLSVTSILPPILFGGLAVIFGVLSKGSGKKMDKKGKFGFSIGLLSLIGAVAITAFTIYLVFFNAEYRSYMNEAYEMTYGITFDEYLDVLKDIYNGDVSEETLNKLPFSLDGSQPGSILDGIAPDGTVLNNGSNDNSVNLTNKNLYDL